MSLCVTPYDGLLFGATILMLLLTVMAWRRRSLRGAGPFAVFLFFSAWWCLSWGAQSAVTDQAMRWVLFRLGFTGVIGVAASWLIFALEYTGRGQLLTKSRRLGLGLFIAADLLVIWTNRWHGLFYALGSEATVDVTTSFMRVAGPAFWVHSVCCYLQVLAGLILLARDRRPHERRQTRILLIGVGVSLAASAFDTFARRFFGAPDITPVGLAITGLLWFWAMFRTELFGIVPVARALVVESMADPVLVLDIDEWVVDCNPAARSLFSLPVVDLAAHRVAEFCEPLASLIAGIVPDTAGREEIGLDTAAGRRCFDLSVQPLFDRKRRRAGRLVVLRDITSRLQAEEALRSLNAELEARVAARTAELTAEAREREAAERRSAALAALGPRLTAANDAAEAARVIFATAGRLLTWDACQLDVYAAEQDRLLPVLRMEVIDGQEREADVTPAYGAQPPSEAARRAIAEGAVLVDGGALDGGPCVPCACMLAAIHDNTGRVRAVLSVYSNRPGAYDAAALGFVRNLAGHCGGALERIDALQSLKHFADRMERSNRELQEFAFIASHDLQEPLRKVRTFGDRLRSYSNDALGERGLDYLARMMSAAERMQTLLESLLAYSRVGTRGLPFVPINLRQPCDEALAALQPRIAELKATIEIRELPTIDADPVQMRDLFHKLVGNALKFHQEGRPPVIVISAGPCRAGAPCDGVAALRDFCEITVADNGIGFDEKYTERIFQVFQRLHGREAYEGSGMGLAVCRRIVDRHEGAITAHSRPGAGSQFIVTLPVRQHAAEAVATLSAA